MNITTEPAVLPASYDEERQRVETLLNNNSLAIAQAESFHRKYPDDAFTNFALAQASIKNGEKYKALIYLEKAVQAGKYHISHVEALARIYLDLRFPQKAINMLHEAIEFSQHKAILLGWLGRHYLQIGRAEPAIKYLQQALELAPKNFRPILQQELFLVFRDANRIEEAQSVLAELERDPAQTVFVITRKVEIEKLDLRGQTAQDLGNLIENAQLSASDKAQALLAYGRLAENSGHFDLAFVSWDESRKLVTNNYDEKEVESNFEKNRVIFTKEAFEKTRTFAHHSNEAIFVGGMPRSGTTLMERILASHPKCKGVGELGRMVQHNRYMIKHFDKFCSVDAIFKESLRGGIRDRATDFLRQAEFVAGGSADYYVDKNPENFLAAGCIHLCLPNAKIINCLRHPADTFISTYQNDFSEQYTYAFNQKAFAHYYLQREKLLLNWRSLFGDRILDVRYEEMVFNPEPQVRRILDFLELQWDPAVLRFYETAQMVSTFSRDQVRTQINTKSVDRWRNYEKYLGPLFETLDKSGYVYPETD